MAKDQGISLTPNEITGMCGRLRCCLIYEYEQYVEARKQLPKRNKRVVTPKGEGKVIDVLPMTNKVMVLIESEEGKRFVETFDPPTIATSGRAGRSSARESASISAAISGPAHATVAKRAMPCVVASARCAVPNASFT